MPAAYALRTLNHAGRLLEPGDQIQPTFVYHGTERTTNLQALVDEGSAAWERPPHPAAAQVELARQDQAELELERTDRPADQPPHRAAAKKSTRQRSRHKKG